MKILALSLLRLGDIFMHQEILRDLKRAYPQAKIDLVLNEQFAMVGPLLHEVDTASHYLAIEAVRYKDRLQISYKISNDCHDALVPSLILQPLVENSVKHGPDSSSEPMKVELEAMLVGGRVKLIVADDGKGCTDPEAALERGGIGLRNVRQRLALLYGASGTFGVSSEGGRGFKVTIELPYETAHKRISTA